MTKPANLSLVHSPSVGFEQPFEMLQACHERIHRMLALLARLRGHLRTHGPDEQAQQAARDVMRYFDQAAPQHHLDEERHVFPPLAAGADAQLAALVQRLQQDHREMEARWPTARAALDRVQDGQALTQGDDVALDAFAALYDAHLCAEEDSAYPAAQHALDQQSLAAMSADMMRRRGVR